MSTGLALGEALVLGLASGPACVASCGPVLVPSLLAEQSGLRLNLRYLGAFLTTRLFGYLLFAGVAWQFGALVSLRAPARPVTFAVIHVALGCVLLGYAYSAGRGCDHSCAAPELVKIGVTKNRGVPGAAVLGFLTGVSLCPPFLAAAVRAAEAKSLAAALLFFAAFFLGTSAWFVPFVGMGWLRRNDAVNTVARMTMLLIALYYLFSGLTILVRKNAYGY